MIYMPVACPGSGKSYVAEEMVKAGIITPWAVVSSDYYREVVSDNRQDMAATPDAFDLCNTIIRARLKKMCIRDSIRVEDESGVSGTGYVAAGVMFDDRSAVVHWNTTISSITSYRDIDDVVAIHGHGGKTDLEWIDS